MQVSMLKSKIHRARVTDANLDYVGSITVDAELLEQANIREFEKVLVADVTNGARLETYAMVGQRGSGCICLNGAAAHLCQVGDTVIIMAFGLFDQHEARDFRPSIVFVDEHNRPVG